MRRVYRRQKRLQLSCTRRYKRDGIEVCFEARVAYNRDNSSDMAATMERLEEYRTYNAQFCKRLYDYLSVMFTTQVRTHYDIFSRSLKLSM
jgi:exocyst complex component 1